MSSNNLSTIILTALATTIIIGGGMSVYQQNRPTTQPTDLAVSPAKTPTTPESPSTTASSVLPSATSDPIASWQTYTDSTYGFSIKYPDKLNIYNSKNEPWNVKTYVPNTASIDGGSRRIISFGPDSSVPGGGIWGINIHDRNKRSVESVIDTMGQQFADRKVTRQNITINGVAAVLVTVATKQVENWVAKGIFIDKNGWVYDISNGALDRPEFTSFYQSITFTK